MRLETHKLKQQTHRSIKTKKVSQDFDFDI